jgi:8-oxo-dGTP pyrophosphatase MutT (NUDIX family)
MQRIVRYQGAIVHEDRLLLIKHQSHADGRGYWVIPGGGYEDTDPTEEACVAREMREETNLEVEVLRLLLEEPAEQDSIYQRKKTYLCRILSGQAAPGYEPEVEASSEYAITEVAWFDLHQSQTWDPLMVADAITHPQVLKIQAALGYTSAQ